MIQPLRQDLRPTLWAILWLSFGAILWLGTFEHLADAGTVELTSISRVFSARNGRKLGGLQTDADLIHGNRGGLVPDDERALWPIAVPVLGPPGVGESPQIL